MAECFISHSYSTRMPATYGRMRRPDRPYGPSATSARERSHRPHRPDAALKVLLDRPLSPVRAFTVINHLPICLFGENSPD